MKYKVRNIANSSPPTTPMPQVAALLHEPFLPVLGDAGVQQECDLPVGLVAAPDHLEEDVDEFRKQLPFAVRGVEKMPILFVVFLDLFIVYVAERVFPDRVDQIVQPAEVVGDGVGNSSRRLGDVLRLDPFHAVPREELSGGPDQQLPGFAGFAGFFVHSIIPVRMNCKNSIAIIICLVFSNFKTKKVRIPTFGKTKVKYLIKFHT